MLTSCFGRPLPPFRYNETLNFSRYGAITQSAVRKDQCVRLACGYGGHAPTLYETITMLGGLPDATRVYPGHDYLKRNLGFTLSVEPGNAAALALVERMEGEPYFTTLGEERAINSFLRLGSPGIRGNLPELAEGAGELAVFLALRKRRDRW
ncbi:hydroxyacylglutathione hydrolase C-terminal domain-containing protein [Sphingosinicella microcystinivorans]|nr:hydroxyacylglutathione hydrolase C-terminal domain-containing protein [Sphingosinicella microcystinivorans]